MRKKLTFEDYLGFFKNPEAKGLSMDQLHEIVLMHGFFRLRTKKDAVRALKSIGMMSPVRSTIGPDRPALPCAPLTVDEVKSDFRSIGWEECPIGSIVAVGSAAEKKSSVSRGRSTATTAAGSAAVVAAQWKKKKKRKKRSVKSLAAVNAVPLREARDGTVVADVAGGGGAPV